MILIESQSRITTLVAENELHKKNNELLEKDYQVILGKQKFRNVLFGFISLLTIGLIAFWVYYEKNKRIKSNLEESRSALFDLTQVLKKKNAEIRDYQVRLQENQVEDKDEMLSELDILNTKILTDEDWHVFKGLFAKAYPNYLQKIRKYFSSITEAEERLFLFIKLNLTTREAADILGIKPETIKKTRSRLRRRLDLGREANLDEFIKGF